VTAAFSEDVVASSISFTLTDAAGNVVPGTVTYDPSTFVATFMPGVALSSATVYTAVVRGAKDAAGNVMADYSWQFTTAPAASGPSTSMWGDTSVPKVAADPDAVPIELGVKFRSDVAGYVTGIRFYKGATNTGVHTGSLWTSDGELLATATFLDESASGWQEVTFDRPVLIEAGVTYVASYHTNAGHYSEDAGYFVSSGVDSGPLHALRSGVDGANGVALYGAGGFPTESYDGANYWVDVLFVAVAG
jgi:hypothetical protein